MDAKKFVRQHFHDAITNIDAELGEGYAKEHPELVGAYLQADLAIVSTLLLIKSAKRPAPPVKSAGTANRRERDNPQSTSRIMKKRRLQVRKKT